MHSGSEDIPSFMSDHSSASFEEGSDLDPGIRPLDEVTLQKQERYHPRLVSWQPYQWGAQPTVGLEAKPVRTFGSFWLVQKEPSQGLVGFRLDP